MLSGEFRNPDPVIVAICSAFGEYKIALFPFKVRKMPVSATEVTVGISTKVIVKVFEDWNEFPESMMRLTSMVDNVVSGKSHCTSVLEMYFAFSK
jgi:hypothetical protein